MTEEEKKTAKLEKICLDNECSEFWEKFPSEMMGVVTDFVYCPCCSEELQLQCSACKESLSNKDFKYCPWCGAEFDS